MRPRLAPSSSRCAVTAAALLLILALSADATAAQRRTDALDDQAGFHLALRTGPEDAAIGYYPGWGVGARVGTRVHPRVAVGADGYVSLWPSWFGWHLAAAVQLTPHRTPTTAIDVDLVVGAGKPSPLTKGLYAVDRETLAVYPVLRAEASWLQRLDRYGAMGPFARLETSPLFLVRVAHLADGSEQRRPQLAFRCHQLLVGVLWDAEVLDRASLRWRLGAGVTAWGDHSVISPAFHSNIELVFDRRPFGHEGVDG
jgi:hypothetical protein